MDVIVEISYRATRYGLWIDVHGDKELYKTLGPFLTEGEREAARAGLLEMMRPYGGRELPVTNQ